MALKQQVTFGIIPPACRKAGKSYGLSPENDPTKKLLPFFPWGNGETA